MNVGKCPGNPPEKDAGDKARKVPGGPQYLVAEVLPLLKSDPARLRVWTVDCGKDVAKLGLDFSEVAILVADAVQNGKFNGSEWCSQKPDGPCAICDAYVLRRTDWNQAAKKNLECEYYVKFAISRAGSILLVSCHT
jgi:hypothetical protein